MSEQLTLIEEAFGLTVVEGENLQLTLDGGNGPSGPAGAAGVAGPNTVTTSTSTTLNGYIFGNGTTIAGATAATDAATPSTLVRRTSGGGASLNGLTLSGTGGSPYTSTLTGGVNFENRTLVLPDVSGTLITLDALQNSATITASTAVAVNTIVLRNEVGQIEIETSSVTGATIYGATASWIYAAGSASAHRTALGLGATGSIAASDPLTVTQTWTNAAATYTGLQVNVTDSGPSNAASLLADFQVGGSSRFTIGKTGFTFRAATIFAGISSDGSGRILLNSSTSAGVRVSGDLQIGSSDTILTRDAASTLAQRNGTNAQTFRVYKTYSSSGANFERIDFRWDGNVAKIGTSKGGTGVARDLVLETDGTERVRVTAAGNVGIGTTSPASKLTVTGGDIETSSIGTGIILKSPDGASWRVTVANGGALTTTGLTPP